MTDKERILTALVSRIYPIALFGFQSDIKKWKELQPTICSEKKLLKKGDLVVAASTIIPNEFSVGFVENIFLPQFVLIREIGSNRLCKYYNEFFYVIDKEILGYEILEGVQYKTYTKVNKAFGKSLYPRSYRFSNISFNDNFCIVGGRRSFENETVFKISFEYNSKITIKSITELINKEILRLIESEKTKNELS